MTPTRQYDATVLRLVSKEEAKNVFFPAFQNDDGYISTFSSLDTNDYKYKRSLFRCWLENAVEHYWIFSTRPLNSHWNSRLGDKIIDTDYFIECDIPDYDENHIWFARTEEGGWFSLDIQSCWQGGVLDVTNELTEKLNKYLKE